MASPEERERRIMERRWRKHWRGERHWGDETIWVLEEIGGFGGEALEEAIGGFG